MAASANVGPSSRESPSAGDGSSSVRVLNRGTGNHCSDSRFPDGWFFIARVRFDSGSGSTSGSGARQSSVELAATAMLRRAQAPRC